MLEPKEIILNDASGKPRKFILTKLPSWDGREIMFKFLSGNMPKLGNYSTSEEVGRKLLSFVYVDLGNIKTRLDTVDLINNHTGDWETSTKLEVKMLEYNCSFFQNGLISTFLDGLAKNQGPKILKTLTAYLAPLFQAVKQPSTN